MSVSPAEDRVWTGPNILTMCRLFWSIALFVCIGQEWWVAGLVMFVIGAASDWLDGVWARATNQISAFGRVMDPLLDKVLICGAFVYLLPVASAGLMPWMVTLVIGRELLITGIRGFLEQQGKKFGADWSGKLKMILQCAFLLAVLIVLAVGETSWSQLLIQIQVVLMWAMLSMTLYSGLQYAWKAMRMLS